MYKDYRFMFISQDGDMLTARIKVSEGDITTQDEPAGDLGEIISVNRYRGSGNLGEYEYEFPDRPAPNFNWLEGQLNAALAAMHTGHTSRPERV